MSAAPTQFAVPQVRPTTRTQPTSVPRVFQVIVILYVLVTGALAQGAQAAFFGLQGGGEAAFTAATLFAVATDIVRIAPLFLYDRHPLGVLHPLILTTVLWPLLFAMPGTIEAFGGLTGLLLGEPVSPQFFAGLGWLPGPELWQAVAWANFFELIALVSIYIGYALFSGRAERPREALRPPKEFDGKRLRILAIALIGVSIGALLILIQLRGGLALHLGDMSRGRFRSLSGLGPLIATVDLGLVALLVWIAARPTDARQPLFMVLMVLVSAAQFISNGARSAAFAAIMMVGLTWALRMRRIPWRLALIMIPLFFVAFGALNLVRTSGLVGQTASEAIQASSTSEALARAQEEILVRRSLESTVPVISQGHDVMGGPLWGSTYAAAIFAFVPRWIWPEKPRGPGSIYTQNFLGEVREGSAVPVPPTAEEYWNFGFPGVILMSALYGALIGYVHTAYVRRHDNPFVVAGFVIFVCAFRFSTDDLVAWQQQTVFLIFTLGLAVVFANRKSDIPLNLTTSPRPMSAGNPNALG
jgi:hypothetical protein